MHRKAVLRAARPIGAETDLSHPPEIEVIAIWVVLWAAKAAHAVEAIAERLRLRLSIAKIAYSLIEVAAAKVGYETGRIFCTLGDDVDHAIHGIRAPDGSSRAANHFNAIDVLKHHILRIPIHAGEKRGVNASSVDQDQKGF